MPLPIAIPITLKGLAWLGGGAAAVGGVSPYVANSLSHNGMIGQYIDDGSAKIGKKILQWTEGSPEVATVLDELLVTIHTNSSLKGKDKWDIKRWIDYDDSFYSMKEFKGEKNQFGIIFHDDDTGACINSMSSGFVIKYDPESFDISIYTDKDSRFHGSWERNDNNDGKEKLQGVIDNLSDEENIKRSQLDSKSSEEAFSDLTEFILSKHHGLRTPAQTRGLFGKWSTNEKNPKMPQEFMDFFKGYLDSLTKAIRDEKNPDRKEALTDKLTSLLKGLRYNTAPGGKDDKGNSLPATTRERFSYQELSGIIKDATGKSNMVELLLDLKASEIAEAKDQPNPKAKIQHLETIFAGIRESVLRKDAKGNFIPEPGLEKDYLAAYNAALGKLDLVPSGTKLPSVASYVLKGGMPDAFDNTAKPGEKSEIDKFEATLPQPAKKVLVAGVTHRQGGAADKILNYQLPPLGLNASSNDKNNRIMQQEMLTVLKQLALDGRLFTLNENQRNIIIRDRLAGYHFTNDDISSLFKEASSK